MIKIDLNKPVLGLDGQAIVMSPTDLSIAMQGKLIAEALARGNSEFPVKVFNWSVQLFSGKPLELDSNEVTILLHLVEKLQIQDLLKAQVINNINNAVLESKIN
jgi:hypothetical protein